MRILGATEGRNLGRSPAGSGFDSRPLHMSRTDKDTPWWVIAPVIPAHARCELDHEHGMASPGVPCTLPPPPAGPVPARPRPYPLATVCGWEAARPPRHFRVEYHSKPSKWFRRHVHSDGYRARFTSWSRRALAEHRATGAVESIPEAYDHRHNAWWLM